MARASGALAGRAVARMNETLPWFADLPPQHRASVGLVVQAGIAAFADWWGHTDPERPLDVTVFGAAPRELVRAISLQQVVELVRVAVEAVEAEVAALAAPGEEALLRETVLRYSRDVAFAAAAVYARAAEERGAWDARLEALVLDAVVRGEGDEDQLPSRAAALGWGNPRSVVVVVGGLPPEEPEAVLDVLRRAGQHAGVDVLAGVHADRVVAVVGAEGEDELATAALLLDGFGPGPVVVGPAVADLGAATASAREALAAAAAVAAWPDAPRPVRAADLLAERALAGDPAARRILVEEVYIPLRDAGPDLISTVSAYVEQTGSLEGTARELFVHPNTVRYRLHKATAVSGLAPAVPRDAFVLRAALVLGRLAEAAGS